MLNIFMTMRILSITLLAFLSLASAVVAQVEVAPTRVILTMRERSKEVNVSNTTDSPLEVDVQLGFKLITSDSAGVQGIDSVGTPEQRTRSAREWLKAFPRRFTLDPRSSRTVRVLATIPDAAEEGEYWARLIVAGTPVAGSVPVDGDTAQGIATNLVMRLELDFPVIVRKGNPSTGIEFNGLQVRRSAAETIALLDMTRTGNSAYRGTLFATLKNASGAEVARLEEQFTTEFRFRKALRFPSLPDGNYLLELESRTVKKGSANDAVIPSTDVRKSYALAVSGSSVTVTMKD